MGIRVSFEAERGCGYRKPGGLYLMGGKLSDPCGKLPFEVGKCPVCGEGIKPSRGYTWIEPLRLFYGTDDVLDTGCNDAHCDSCPVGGAISDEPAGLIWIGGRYYPTPHDFNREANAIGISRKIPSVPRDFEVGKTWVFLAHREVIHRNCEPCDGRGVILDSDAEPEAGTLLGSGEVAVECEDCDGDGIVAYPAIFSVFLPTRIEQIVEEDCSEEEAEKIRKRGIEPVIVKRLEEHPELFADGGEPEHDHETCGGVVGGCEVCAESMREAKAAARETVEDLR